MRLFHIKSGDGFEHTSGYRHFKDDSEGFIWFVCLNEMRHKWKCLPRKNRNYRLGLFWENWLSLIEIYAVSAFNLGYGTGVVERKNGAHLLSMEFCVSQTKFIWSGISFAMGNKKNQIKSFFKFIASILIWLESLSRSASSAKQEAKEQVKWNAPL